MSSLLNPPVRSGRHASEGPGPRGAMMKLKLVLTAGIVGLVASLLGAAAARADPFAYVPNLLDNTVSQYDVGAGGLLAPLSPATVATAGGNFGVAVSPDGRSVYVTGFSVSQFDV